PRPDRPSPPGPSAPSGRPSRWIRPSHPTGTGSRARVGLLPISAGRDYVRRDVHEHIDRAAAQLAGMLREAGHEVITAPEPVTSNALATSQARWVADHHPDITILHHSVCTFPHSTALAAEATRGPLPLLANIDPKFPA